MTRILIDPETREEWELISTISATGELCPLHIAKKREPEPREFEEIDQLTRSRFDPVEFAGPYAWEKWEQKFARAIIAEALRQARKLMEQKLKEFVRK